MKLAVPKHVFGAAEEELKRALRSHPVRRVNMAKRQPSGTAPSPAGTSEGAPPRTVLLAEGVMGEGQGDAGRAGNLVPLRPESS